MAKAKDMETLCDFSKQVSGLENYPPLGSIPKMYHLAVKPCLASAVVYIFGNHGLRSKIRRAQKQEKLLKRFPGPSYYPILGSLPKMIPLIKNPCRDILPYLRFNMKRTDPYFVFWLLNQPKLFVGDPDIALDMLRNGALNAKGTEITSNGKTVKSEGLITMDAENHPHRRKIWQQGFTRKIIENSNKIFCQEGKQFANSLALWANTKQEFNMMWPAINCTFKTIAYSAFGGEYCAKMPDAQGKQHVQTLHKLSVLLFNRVFRPWQWIPDSLYLHFTWDGFQVKQCIKSAHKFTQNAVKERQNLRNCNSKTELPCFLDLLLDYKENGELTEEEIAKELNLFIVAGYDTSGLTLLYLLYLISLDSSIQGKVVNELVSIFGENLDSYEEITPAQVRQMKYLEMCIKETLRLYPVVPFSYRRTTEEVKLPDGRVIPEGVDVYIVMPVIHKDPKYFPQPDKFMPERHTSSIPALIPFSLGSRNCIGQVYAMQEIKIIAAHLLLKYKWETVEEAGLEPLMHPLLSPDNGIKFKITNRFSN